MTLIICLLYLISSSMYEDLLEKIYLLNHEVWVSILSIEIYYMFPQIDSSKIINSINCNYI